MPNATASFPGMQVRYIHWPTELKESEAWKRKVAKQVRFCVKKYRRTRGYQYR